MTHDEANKIKGSFETRFPGLVEAVEVREGRFRFEVWTDRFNGVGHDERQDQVWAIVDDLLGRGELPPKADLDISMILCYAETDPFIDFKGYVEAAELAGRA